MEPLLIKEPLKDLLAEDKGPEKARVPLLVRVVAQTKLPGPGAPVGGSNTVPFVVMLPLLIAVAITKGSLPVGPVMVKLPCVVNAPLEGMEKV